MDVFQARSRLIDDNREFTTSFVDVRDERIAVHVEAELAAGKQWPEPWISTRLVAATGTPVAIVAWRWGSRESRPHRGAGEPATFRGHEYWIGLSREIEACPVHEGVELGLLQDQLDLLPATGPLTVPSGRASRICQTTTPC